MTRTSTFTAGAMLGAFATGVTGLVLVATGPVTVPNFVVVAVMAALTGGAALFGAWLEKGEG